MVGYTGYTKPGYTPSYMRSDEKPRKYSSNELSAMLTLSETGRPDSRPCQMRRQGRWDSDRALGNALGGVLGGMGYVVQTPVAAPPLTKPASRWIIAIFGWVSIKDA